MKFAQPKGRRPYKFALLASFVAGASSLAVASAQEAPPPAVSGGDSLVLEEIIVTARKRSETLIEVPAAISAVGALELERSAVNGVDALARKIPGFVIGEGGGTIQGGSIALRGISASDSNPLGDQAVSFNIDGVQVARATVRRMGDFDTAQVEVMKGPQALFYGKNSPGGIISTRTADPTDRFEAGGKLGYEIVAHETRGEAYISAPVTEALGARLAVYGSHMRGWVKNDVPRTDPLAPKDEYGPKTDEYAVRGTLKYDDGGPFNARMKLAYNDVKGAGSGANYQYVHCPRGQPLINVPGVAENCKADDRISTGALGSGFATALAPMVLSDMLRGSDFGDGQGTLRQKQWLGGLEMNYDVADDLTLTSVTGLYDVQIFNRTNFTATSLPSAILGSVNALDIREISQELRLTSNFSGPFNFMFGGQFQDSRAKSASIAAFGAIPGQISVVGRPSPFIASGYLLDQKGEAYSAFAQLQYKITPELELSVGGRLSTEEKELVSVLDGTSLATGAIELVGVRPLLSNGNQKKSFNNLSPEFTLSYKPDRNLNFYGSYKEGFLSGGFNGGSANFNGDLSYRPQYVKGWEAGVKGHAFDGALTADLALYTYDITDLQVQVTTQGTVQELRNAGEVSSKGAELSLNYRFTDDFSVYGNVAYARGRYDAYYAACYAGQTTVTPGTGVGQCGTQPNPTNNNIVGLLQNLSGTELIRSPEWTGNVGFVYETPVTEAFSAELSGGMSFSSSYITNASSQPNSRQPNYALLDATVRFLDSDGKWEFAVIGRNLTDKYYIVRGTDIPARPAGTVGYSDIIAVVNRGREVMIRMGYKY
ncbi:TonB-dependent receptor [Niveispirillum sp. SYP-B3756]|uniref:TonB-dependent receptor n=1 Tax=Niveispirillum sp. SYP-B3756 TaxID=2662178 RepID=UPI0012916FBD|nr:TonB-dependent receptor [Niveispirillum sp. SYP-B3756]MQP68609.1 TonB-dependent receptor [Niveispirillum sp. SYP-B3756]